MHQNLPNIVYQPTANMILVRNNLANRTAVASYGQADILTKITYPTGGYRQFIYEGNTALVPHPSRDQYPEAIYFSGKNFTRTNFRINPSPDTCLAQFFTVNSTDGGVKFTYNFSGVGVACSGYVVKLFKTTTLGQTAGAFSDI